MIALSISFRTVGFIAAAWIGGAVLLVPVWAHLMRHARAQERAMERRQDDREFCEALWEATP